MGDEVPNYSLSDMHKIPDPDPSSIDSITNSISKGIGISKKSPQSSQKMNLKTLPNLVAQNRESRVVRFLNKVNNYFVEMLAGTPKAPKNEVNLMGRIHEFQKDIDYATKHLSLLRRELEQDGQSDYPFLISSVIDPLLKEISRLGRAGEQHLSTAQQVKESKEYGEWIEKAKKWIDLCGKRHTHKDVIHKAFIDHTYCEFRNKIDKDLQVIQDYLNLFMDKLEGNDLVKIELQDQLEQELSQHIFELYLLKDHQPQGSLEALNDWRVEAEAARESYFSEALHVIDTNIGGLMQPAIIDEGVDQYEVAIDEQLVSLEEKIAKFEAELKDLEMGKKGREDKIKNCSANLAKLEDEAHSLNRNLQLTHEQITRVQHVIEVLAIFRFQLESKGR